MRPESVEIVAAEGAAKGANTLRGLVKASSFLGGSVRYDVEVGDQALRVSGPAETIFPAGTEVRLAFMPQAIVALG